MKSKIDVLFITGIEGAGKTTLSNLIKEKTDCNIIKIDRFVAETVKQLKPNMTKEELRKLGGGLNIAYGSNQKAILNNLPYLLEQIVPKCIIEGANCYNAIFEKLYENVNNYAVFTIIKGNKQRNICIGNEKLIYDVKDKNSINQILKIINWGDSG